MREPAPIEVPPHKHEEDRESTDEIAHGQRDESGNDDIESTVVHAIAHLALHAHALHRHGDRIEHCVQHRHGGAHHHKAQAVPRVPLVVVT